MHLVSHLNVCLACCKFADSQIKDDCWIDSILDYIGRQRQRQKRSVDEFDDACTMDVEPQHLATKQAKGNSKSDLMKEGNHSKEITSFFKPQD